MATLTFRRIEIADRDEQGRWRWRAIGPGDVWFSAYGDVDVDEVYEAIDTDATTRLPTARSGVAARSRT